MFIKPGVTIGILAATIIVGEVQNHILRKQKNALVDQNAQLALFAVESYKAFEAYGERNVYLSKKLDDNGIVFDEFDKIAMNFEVIEED